MNRYLFSLIRFVPDYASGEFVNIGAIAGSDEQNEWRSRTVANPKRALAIDKGDIFESVMGRVTGLQRVVDASQAALDAGEDAEASEAWLARLHRVHQRVLQMSEPMPMMAETADEALDFIFRELVTDPTKVARGARTRSTAHALLGSAYRKLLPRSPVERPLVEGIEHPARFDFAVASGSVVQLSSAWSFEVMNLKELTTEVHAWSWTVQSLRQSADAWLADPVTGNHVRVSPDTEVEVLYLPPKTAQGRTALDQALTSFRSINVEARPEAEVDLIAGAAVAKLAVAH